MVLPVAACTSFLDVADFLNCGSFATFGGDGTIFTIGALLIFALFAYKARLNPTLSMVFAWGLTYAFYLMFGSASQWLQMIIAVLSIGIGVRLVSGILTYGR